MHEQKAGGKIPKIYRIPIFVVIVLQMEFAAVIKSKKQKPEVSAFFVGDEGFEPPTPSV